MYAALNASKEKDLQKLRGLAVRTKDFVLFESDFSNGDSQEELSNKLGSVLGGIMTLREILKSKRAELGISRESIDNGFKGTEALQIVRDLRVANEHGWPPNSSWTGQKPQVRALRRAMQLRTSAKNNSSIMMTFDANGYPRTFGDGTAEAVLEGEVISEDGVFMGNLSTILNRAIVDLEVFLTRIGVIND